MANHKSALKRNRQSLVRRARNRSIKSTVKTALRRIDDAVAELMLSPHGIFGLLAFRYVANDAREQPQVIDSADVQFNRKGLTISTTSNHFSTDSDDPGFTRTQVAFNVFIVFVTKRRRHQHGNMLSDCLGARVAEHRLGGRIEALDDAISVDGDDRFGSSAAADEAQADVGLCGCCWRRV